MEAFDWDLEQLETGQPIEEIEARRRFDDLLADFFRRRPSGCLTHLQRAPKHVSQKPVLGIPSTRVEGFGQESCTRLASSSPRSKSLLPKVFTSTTNMPSEARRSRRRFPSPASSRNDASAYVANPQLLNAAARWITVFRSGIGAFCSPLR